jgi:hypothetical protein
MQWFGRLSLGSCMKSSSERACHWSHVCVETQGLTVVAVVSGGPCVRVAARLVGGALPLVPVGCTWMVG